MSPELAAFVSRVERDFDRNRIETFWHLEPHLLDLVGSGYACRALNNELQNLLRDSEFIGDWHSNQLVLHRGQSFALAVWLFDKPRQYIHSLPYYGMYIPLGKEVLQYDMYRLPEGYDNQVFDPNIKLEPIGSERITSGDVLRLQTDAVVYDFRVSAPVAVLKLTTAPFHTLEWLFNRESLFAWQANDSALTASQLRVAAYVLGKLANPTSIEPLSSLTSHAHHSVRWAAIQSLGRISRTAALQKLTIAVNDPHPHVRRAAVRVLAQLSARI